MGQSQDTSRQVLHARGRRRCSGRVKGGKHGHVIVKGKSAESVLIQMAGHMRKPIMPPVTEDAFAVFTEASVAEVNVNTAL